MNEAKDLLWRCLQPLLSDFAERIAASDSRVSYSVGCTSNDVFFIRGYASLQKRTTYDEIAVTVDAVFKGNEVVLSADVCMDDGEILANGPEATLPLLALLSSSEPSLAEWLGRFEDFLASIEVAVKERVAHL